MKLLHHSFLLTMLTVCTTCSSVEEIRIIDFDTEQHEGAVRTILNEAKSRIATSDAPGVTELYAICASADCCTRLVTKGDTVIGLVNTCDLEYEGGPKLLVVNILAVTQRERGKGYGTRLFTDVDQPDRYDCVGVSVRRDNPDAQNFYKKLGLKEESSMATEELMAFGRSPSISRQTQVGTNLSE